MRKVKTLLRNRRSRLVEISEMSSDTIRREGVELQLEKGDKMPEAANQLGLN